MRTCSECNRPTSNIICCDICSAEAGERDRKQDRIIKLVLVGGLFVTLLFISVLSLIEQGMALALGGIVWGMIGIIFMGIITSLLVCAIFSPVIFIMLLEAAG